MTEFILAMSVVSIVAWFIDGILEDSGAPKGLGCSLTFVVMFIIAVIITI